jgi:hypothetical protein
MKIGTGMTKNLIFRLFTIPSLINKEKSVELFFEIPACGRQVCNQRAKSNFSELSPKKP